MFQKAISYNYNADNCNMEFYNLSKLVAFLRDLLKLFQSHSYLLQACYEANRLALMSMANKHTLGMDGVPMDYNQAYGLNNYLFEI